MMIMMMGPISKIVCTLQKSLSMTWLFF